LKRYGLCGLLKRLPLLPLGAKDQIDFPAADPALLAAIAEDAETTMRVFHCGIGAIGRLLANSSDAVEDGSIGCEALEALDLFMAEFGDLAAACQTLAGHCRRETADFVPHKAARAKSGKRVTL
jgi:hypothetical protein